MLDTVLKISWKKFPAIIPTLQAKDEVQRLLILLVNSRSMTQSPNWRPLY